jgi:hypothetical protein
MAHDRLPSDDAINDFYRAWFERNYCTPPAAKANAAITAAIKAALEHFNQQRPSQD